MNTGSTGSAAATTAVPNGNGEGFVELCGITKRFPGVLANDDISLDFRPGEIHVLLGENGAGKSTLIGILAGMQQPDAGEIRVRGASVRIGSPRESLELGIGTVFQHVLLVQSLTVLENLMLGGAWWRGINRDAALKRFRELSELLALEISPDALVGRLSLGQQQQVEIVRALWRGEGVLVLDEPTSMLTPEGVRELGQVMVRLRDEGVAIVFITHKLQEAYAFGDRISVLRLGRLVGSIDKERLSGMDEQAVTDEVIRLMFGSTEGHDEDAETLSGLSHHRPHLSAEPQAEVPCLSLRAVSTRGDVGECPLQDVSFSLFPGEILGIAGVDGNGQKHLAEAVAGQRLVVQGEISLEGAKIERLGVPGRRKLGIRYITDERLGEGTVAAFSVAHNVVMKEIGQPPLWRHGISLWDRIFAHARGQISGHDVRTPSERTPIGRLSGGNIQKVLLARELADDLAGEAKVVVFNKPTYGLDLQSTRFARDRIRRGAESGLATILISTELDELIELSDRIAVMFQGRLAGIVENGEEVEREIGLLMTGAASA